MLTTFTQSTRRALAVTVAVASVLVMSVVQTVSAGAVSTGGNSPFGLAVPANKQGVSAPYFVIAAQPGSQINDKVVVTNSGRNTETIDLSPTLGTTAPNSGSSFSGAFKDCSGAACWITGLPSSVTLAAGASRTLPFTLTVPSGIASSQYLAGITGQPAHASAPIIVGQNGVAKAQAIVINQVTVGVAVTVGDAASLASNLKIVNVLGAIDGSQARLSVLIQNDGQKFAKGSGSASCTTDGSSISLPVQVDTILPGQEATVVANASGLSAKAIAHCTVTIGYASGSNAQWAGNIKIPSVQTTPGIHTAPGVYESLPSQPLPTWAIALFALGGVLVIVMLVLLVVMTRRRHAAKLK